MLHKDDEQIIKEKLIRDRRKDRQTKKEKKPSKSAISNKEHSAEAASANPAGKPGVQVISREVLPR